MHACLQIAEIVFKILEKADEIPRPPPDASSWISCAHDEYQATLRRDPVLSLARVCKAFHLQAICFIWREIILKGNIEPFIKCFRDTDWIRSTTGAHVSDPEIFVIRKNLNIVLSASPQLESYTPLRMGQLPSARIQDSQIDPGER